MEYNKISGQVFFLLARSDRMRTVDCSHHLLYRTQFYSNETSRSEVAETIYKGIELQIKVVWFIIIS